MYREVVLIWIVTVCVQIVNLQNLQGTGTTSGGYDLLLSKIESRLKIASKIVDTARRELRSDLKEICLNNTCNGNSIDYSKWKRNYPDEKPSDCGDIYRDGYIKSGIYQIWPLSKISTGPLLVYCDMADGGGWTVIQRRGDFGNSRDYFLQDWNAYKTGFGHLLREFWIGNDNLFTLTSQKHYRLKVDLKDFEEDLIKYATYSMFWVDDEIHNYTLHIGIYEGTAGDSLQRQNGSKFSTYDKDNDSNPGAHCSDIFKGAWWHSACMDSNLNGIYMKGTNGRYGEGVVWKQFKGFEYSLKDSVMKIRPTDFGSRVSNTVN